jgi:hypothetical protein
MRQGRRAGRNSAPTTSSAPALPRSPSSTVARDTARRARSRRAAPLGRPGPWQPTPGSRRTRRRRYRRRRSPRATKTNPTSIRRDPDCLPLEPDMSQIRKCLSLQAHTRLANSRNGVPSLPHSGDSSGSRGLARGRRPRRFGRAAPRRPPASSCSTLDGCRSETEASSCSSGGRSCHTRRSRRRSSELLEGAPRVVAGRLELPCLVDVGAPGATIARRSRAATPGRAAWGQGSLTWRRAGLLACLRYRLRLER